MNDLVVKNVPFCGAELLAVQEKTTGDIYAGVNSVLKELGFEDRQIEYRRNKWSADKVISKGVQKFSYPSENGGVQESYCINIKKLPLALAKLAITPKMEKEMPWLSDRLEQYQESCADVLADSFLIKVEKQSAKKKEKLPSVNQMVKNIKGALHDAGVDSKYIAAEVVRIYSDAGYPVNVPLISDVPVLWDCTSIAKELGIMSESGRPHDKAVSGIIQKLDLFTYEIVKTVYSRNGHDGVTVQYKDSVFQKVKEWLEENGYPTVIELELANGNVNRCRVVYSEVA